jgi:nicotinamide-nucleotide amidase
MWPSALTELAAAVLRECGRSGLTIVTAESCTGGLLAACLTEIAGSSTVYERGWVTYSNEGKNEMLGVPASLIAKQGAVSSEVAEAMAAGALERSPAQLALSITGIAGPGGATATKPVGLVYIAIGRRGAAVRHERHLFIGSRGQVRLASVQRALILLREAAITC